VRLIGDPQSTRAWKQDADEAIRVARQLARHLSGRGVVFLHDRRIPGRGRANIDHIAIGPGGITVIDTKSARGRLRSRSAAGSSPHAANCCSSTNATALTWSTDWSVSSRRFELWSPSSPAASWTFGAPSAFRTSTDHGGSG
jgi:hypothetical protein